MSITYSTNFMGPISLDWYKKRGLTKTVSQVLTEDNILVQSGKYKAGDTWTREEITTNYAGGRIDIRDDSKYGYDGWDEYGIAPMHGEDWNVLSKWLDDIETQEQLGYDELIELFESETGRKIRWAKEG